MALRQLRPVLETWIEYDASCSHSFRMIGGSSYPVNDNLLSRRCVMDGREQWAHAQFAMAGPSQLPNLRQVLG